MTEAPRIAARLGRLPSRLAGTIRRRVGPWVGEREATFVHIPKTGGSYVRIGEDRPLSPIRSLGHRCIADRPSNLPPAYPPPRAASDGVFYTQGARRRFYFFSTVRNPFDWLVSYWAHAGGHDPRYHNPDHYDYDAASKGFEYLVKTLADRIDPWPSRRLIHLALFSAEGRWTIDWLNRHETLDPDLERLARHRSLEYRRRDWRRVAPRRRDWREYYTDGLVELVTDTWGRELRLFGYDFHGPTGRGLLGPGEVPRKRRRRFRYDVSNDVLTVDGP